MLGPEVCLLVLRQIAIDNCVDPVVFALLIVGTVKNGLGNLLDIALHRWLLKGLQEVG